MPYIATQLNPASYDITLGDKVLVENMAGEWVEHSLPYTLQPGEFVLLSSREYFNIPEYMEAQVQLKSSRAREGYEHLLAGYIDPGFSGNITLEVKNVKRYGTLPLVASMRLCQIRFMKVDMPCRKSYKETGHYMYNKGVHKSKVNLFGVPY